MDIPFPTMTPALIDYEWFNSDLPCDEEAELTELEQEQKNWINYVCQQYKKKAPVVRSAPEPMEEVAETDDEDGNDESDESEESHDDDEEDRTTYSPERVNNEVEQDTVNNTPTSEQTLTQSPVLWS